MAACNRSPASLNVMGDVNDSLCYIENVECRALIDTGSTISSVSEEFYKTSLAHLPLHSFSHFLSVECAGGEYLPYKGYIEAQLEIPGKSVGFKDVFIFLVVPETKFSSYVPLLIGTNIIRPLLDFSRKARNNNLMVNADFSDPWVIAFRALSLGDKGKKKIAGRVALVKCATRNTVKVEPNGRAIIPGFVNNGVNVNSLFLTQETAKSSLPGNVEITPLACCFAAQSDYCINVELANTSRNSVIIQPNSILCELQAVEPADMSEFYKGKDFMDKDNFLSKFNLDDTILNEVEKQKVLHLLQKYKHIFSVDESDIGHANKYIIK